MGKIKRIIIPVFLLIISGLIFMIAPYYQIGTQYNENEVRVILDNTEITRNEKKLPDPAIIKNGKILLSQNTVDILFDKWLYYDEKYNTIITTTDTGIAKLPLDNNTIKINDTEINIEVPATKINEIIYIPIEELEEFYQIEITYNEKVIITSKKAVKLTVSLREPLKIKSHKQTLSRTVAIADVDEIIDVFEYRLKEGDKGYDPNSPEQTPEWVSVRTSKGDLGYVKINSIKMQKQIGEIINLNAIEYEIDMPKINIAWEYAENYTPNREDEEKIERLDVLSPTWLYAADTDGELRNKIDKDYIKWAHEKGYKIWAVLKNDDLNINETSELVTDMYARENLINETIKIALENEIDGINLDFEEMKKEDINEFSQFVRELSATARRNELTISVDVTVPDGSDVWSLCYDRYQITDAADYIILMAYDQYSAGSKTPGSVATLTWVEENIKKMIERDNIDKDKLILGIPFYSRLWTIEDGKVRSLSIDMENAIEYLNKNYGTLTWLEEEGQYYFEYETSSRKTMVWIEDTESLKNKIELINKYDLAGGAYWRLNYEIDDVWEVIQENMNIL